MRSIQKDAEASSLQSLELQVPEIAVDQVIDRMKAELGVKTDKELGENLGLSKTAVSSWRSRNSVPLDVLVEVAVSCISSIDYLVFGKENTTPSMYDGGIDVSLMEVCVYYVERTSDRRRCSESVDFADSALHARSIALWYSKWLDLQNQLVGTGKISKSDFLGSLKKHVDSHAPLEANQRAGEPLPPDEKAG